MNLKKAHKILTAYQRWRRGQDDAKDGSPSLPAHNPIEIGLALDAVLEATGKMLKTKAAGVPDDWRDLCARLIEIADRDCDNKQGSPNHAHERPGIWDSDNGKLANKPCAECELYDHARRMLAKP